MSEARKAILKVMGKRKNAVTTEALAERTGFSIKTIRNQIGMLQREGVVQADPENYYVNSNGNNSYGYRVTA